MFKALMIVNLLTIMVLLPTWSMACDKGCTPVGNVCACDPAPAEVAKPVEGVTGTVDHNVKIDMPDSLRDKDLKQDQENQDADAQGKAAANIPQ